MSFFADRSRGLFDSRSSSLILMWLLKTYGMERDKVPGPLRERGGRTSDFATSRSNSNPSLSLTRPLSDSELTLVSRRGLIVMDTVLSIDCWVSFSVEWSVVVLRGCWGRWSVGALVGYLSFSLALSLSRLLSLSLARSHSLVRDCGCGLDTSN